MAKATLDDSRGFSGRKAIKALKSFEEKREKLLRYLEIRIEEGICIFKRCGYDKDHAKDLMWHVYLIFQISEDIFHFYSGLCNIDDYCGQDFFSLITKKLRKAKLTKLKVADAEDLYIVLFKIIQTHSKLHLYNQGIAILKKNLKKGRK